MASESVLKRTSQIQLDNGTDDEGKQRTVNVSLSGLSASSWDATKYLAICNALAPCLDKEVYSTNVVNTVAISA